MRGVVLVGSVAAAAAGAAAFAAFGLMAAGLNVLMVLAAGKFFSLSGGRTGVDATGRKVGGFTPPLAAMAFLAAVGGGWYGLSYIPGATGYRDAAVRKVSETGVYYKTWEVEAVGDVVRPGGDDAAQGPQMFRYTVRDPAVLDRVKAVPDGRRVRLFYTKYLATWRPRGDTNYVLTGAEVLPETR